MEKLSSQLYKIAQTIKAGGFPSLYHTSYYKFEPGDIIKPYWSLDKGDSTAESLIETTRLEKYKKKPSRLKSVFCWDDLETAEADTKMFLDSGRPRYLYKVAPLGKVTKADINAYEKLLASPENIKQSLAERYWEPADTEKSEILVEGGIKVLSSVDFFKD